MCVVFRYGRVNYVLAKRLELLDEVSRLQKSLGVQGDVAFTCETARYLTAKLFITYFLGILVRMVLQRSSWGPWIRMLSLGAGKNPGEGGGLTVARPPPFMHQCFRCSS